MLQDQALRTIACDNQPDCNKTITFNRAEEKVTFDNPGNVWLRSIRMVQTLDQRQLVYCSDICELNGVRSGKHNLPEQKKIIEAANPAAVAAAAQAAEATRQSNENLKAGTGGPIVVTD